MGLQGYVGSAEDQARIRRLEKERELEKERVEAARKATAAQPVGFRSWRHGATEVLEAALKKETVGLVSRDEFVAKKANIEAKLEEEARKRKREEEDARLQKQQATQAQQAKSRRRAKLSFDVEEEDEVDSLDGTDGRTNATAAHTLGTPVKLRKNDEVATEFLPDAEREKAMEAARGELKQSWLREQAALKERELHVKFSYWDGAGHQRHLALPVGATVEEFVKQAKALLEADFPQLRHVSVANLLLVKNDVIVPHALTFYKLIVGLAHSKSGERLFDVEQSLDAQRAHACKVVQRHWYESNKHIYPSNRWEIYDEDVHVRTGA